MLGWVGSWWSVGSFTGPARNAPNDGINIKKLFDQRPKQVITLSEAEVKQELKKLRPTKINAVPPLTHKPPIMQEFEDVFANGYKNYFEARKKRLSNVNTETLTPVSCEDEISPSSNTDIVPPSTCNDVSIHETSVSSLDPLDSCPTDDTSDVDSDTSDYVMSKEEIMAELAEFSSI